ncbi:MAG TPA: response regulator [Polyangiaceae bacterium]
MRVLKDGHLLARLSAVREHDSRLTAVWHGAPPPFGPSEQLEPLMLESDDGLQRREGWLLNVVRPVRGEVPLRVEIGTERDAPPWRKSVPPGQQPTTGRVPARTAQPLDILVVDDEVDAVSLVAAALEQQGWRVRRAFSGRQALARAAERAPDVAIIDLIMPEVSGEEVCAALRRDPRCSHTRVLVVSGAEDTRVVAAGCDADSAVTKPFTTDLLIREVRRLVEE